MEVRRQALLHRLWHRPLAATHRLRQLPLLKLLLLEAVKLKLLPRRLLKQRLGAMPQQLAQPLHKPMLKPKLQATHPPLLLPWLMLLRQVEERHLHRLWPVLLLRAMVVEMQPP